jgi:zinc transporter 1/2/3
MQNNPEIIPSNLTKIFLSSPIQTSTSVFYLKIFYLIIIWAISFIFGLLPLCFNNCRKDLRLLNYANAFSAGIFLGIGFFHILPEATENFENYFLNEGKDSYIKGWPIVYLLAFLSYSLILYIEKVAFNSHALIAHTHGEGHNSDEENLDDDLKEPLLAGNNDNKEDKKIYHDCTNDLFEDDNKEDELYFRDKNNERDDEQIIRNIISSKGQFSSVLQSRNLSKY